ncbi:MAG: hypothetical protein AVDCRST_MAG19-3103 [uncultured Thermomicrobiales bacterium]|uniref:Uncharacterized protein n=1 Tax=uncultured Thermomicrobiales bacterium TaxID=1645740 RepID=A0A6J4VCS5_9BACT|nr:MAG: hypothetical protein AVDCRST_MAG19-3103 [uncultured Thermomicrobiales bacterium]
MTAASTCGVDLGSPAPSVVADAQSMAADRRGLPAAAAVLASVEEEPAASLARAPLDPHRIPGDEQLSGGAGPRRVGRTT